MTDWFDPLGLSRVTDAMSTGAARTLLGRQVELDRRGIGGRIAAVHQVAPANAMVSMLQGQFGLWRRLDVEFVDVTVDARTIATVRVAADDIRAVEALPQRLRADAVTVHAHVGGPETAAWLQELAPEGVEVRVEQQRLLARMPGLARFGEVELEPYAAGTTVGARVRHAWFRRRRVELPARFHRTLERDLEWLPPTTSIESLTFTEEGGVEIRAAIERYSVEVDVARLMTDLTARSTAGVIEVLLGGS